ncbi:E3 ubiquitin/ISG15 ligase TRIM25-like isoform X1 [Amblyraja radiata]|uniref:E3 ubiquitin/ISG15 ligase TRIM25-like isoform X1 n=1 Tax=Amblyraja radiata TaxID=386614 RepID=UPI001401EF7D|nr:E3 ubiquitin/ISG15 ligase TRIM25-like isoform X1 [Amblyraja radiata]
MAAAGLTEELTCAVCLSLYQDPVALPCQHSFCAKCISDAWDHSEFMCGVNCPQCHRNFNPRPSLVKNHTLQNIVEKYSQSQPTAPAARPSPVMCEYCIDSPSPAVKTCLRCETSFCSHHLQPHLTKQIYKDHGLIEPIADFTTRQCPTHKKVLEFYCEQEEECVCVSCTIIGKHKSHSLLSLEVGQEKVKGILKDKFENLRKVQKDWSSEQQDLKQSEIECKRFSKELKEKLSATFSEWRKQLEEDEKSSLEMIDEEMQRVLSQITSNSESLLKKMEDMKIIEKEVQDQEQKDPLSFLQDAKQLLSRYSQFQTSKTTVTQQEEIPLKSNSDFGCAFQALSGQSTSQPGFGLPASSGFSFSFGRSKLNTTGNSEQRTQGLQFNSQPRFGLSASNVSSFSFGSSTLNTAGNSEQRTQGLQFSSQPVFGASTSNAVSFLFGDNMPNTTGKSEQSTQGPQINSTSQQKCHTMNLSNIASIVQKNFNEYQKYQTTIMDMLRRSCDTGLETLGDTDSD